MRVVCVWREGQDYSRTVSDWIEDFRRATGKEIESLDPDSLEGEMFCNAYGIVEYPTMLALDNNGAVLESWRGSLMPTFNAVAYWA